MVLWAMVVEIVGILVVAFGVAIEIVYKASTGLICITAGSLLLAIGGFIWAKMMPRSGPQNSARGPQLISRREGR